VPPDEVPRAVAGAAAAFGFETGSLRVLGGNSGSAWGAGEFVLRVGRPPIIDAELAASAAAAAVLPVPAVLDRAEVDDLSAVLLKRCPERRWPTSPRRWTRPARGQYNAVKPNYSCGTLITIASWVDRAITTTASVPEDGFSSRCGTCGGTQT
jgi:hypothetical protein